MVDTRIVSSARCTWWDGIDKIGLLPPSAHGHRLPCCPHCASPLYEYEDENRFWAGAEDYEADGHPGYIAMLTWGRGKCFPSMAALKTAYEESLNAQV